MDRRIVDLAEMLFAMGIGRARAHETGLAVVHRIIRWIRWRLMRELLLRREQRARVLERLFGRDLAWLARGGGLAR